MMKTIRDVAVLGAGIAGSSLAKAMADRGWDTVLIDRHSFPRHKVCGEFLSPESQSTLKALGLGELVESLHPSMMTRVRLILSHGAVLDIPLPDRALGISRYALDQALHSAAIRSGVDVQTAAAVTSVSQSGGGYTIEISREGEKTVCEARAVIAAWGANPRSGLPGHPSNRSAKNTFMGVKSHYRGIAMDAAVELYFFPGGYLGLAPVEGGIVNAAALLKREAFRVTGKSIPEIIEAAGRKNPKLDAKLAQAVPVPGTQAAVAPVKLSRRPVAWDVIPRVGDASLMVPPLCGDGMSMGLRSARLCAPLADGYLRGEMSLSEWEREYTLSVRQEFTGPLRWGRLLQSLLGFPAVPRLLLGLAHLAPELAYEMVRATRLKETDV